MQTVKLTPMRMIFNNPESNFSIISCRTKDESIETHPKYGTISLKGTGIADLKMGQSIDCIIELCVDDKYKYSYKFIGFAGFVVKDGKFNLTEKAELQMLRSLMINGQAESCHAAYPHFVSMVLNGEADKLDYKKIRGVGKVLLPRYIDKIKTINKRVEFMGETYSWGIEHDEDINKIAATYKNVYGFSKDINTNPYAVMINLLEWSFDRADKAITKKTAKWLDSYERCEAATIYALKYNELDGNTRMQAKALFDVVKRKAPQCVHHLLDVVTKSAQVHYDAPSQNTALQATYSAEEHIADVIKKKIANPHYYPMDWQKFTTVDGLELTDEQAQILEMACKQDVMMLTGSAGSGKSATTKAIIEMLEANNYTYTLLSPTGIAAKRLREATGREASTIHMFLTCDGNLGDYVLIDEMGMVSVHLLSMLFDKVTDTTKIIFIADPSQLASIACGNIVEDVLDSGIVPVCNLTKVFRYNTSGIITIATDVRSGVNGHLTDTFTDYKFIETDTLVINQIEQEYARLLADGYSKDDVLILSPFNKGDVGSLAINAAIQAKFNPNELSTVGHTVNDTPIYFKVGDKVINKKNEYAMPLVDDDTAFVANGDIGTVMEIVPNEKEPYMIVRYDCGDCIVDKAHIKNTLLAYAISIHSCQGSQAKAVIVVIDRSHVRMLSRNLCYTAVSRAQERLILIGDETAIQEGLKVQEEKERNTELKEMLIK
uniref:ATP dependent DNA helicase n=1 Tax=Siphoviridae sp. ctKcB20 TaxID=2827568 RepID=A0A8S5LLB5_9CAUD|nr:MAG TPA: ATP dependent DNA helicase [Siphoviridae sp. ctKcB20]